MTDKYTKRDCERAVARLADLLGKSTKPYIPSGGKGFKGNPGAWYCDYNSVYGGAVVAEIVNEGGGITHPMGEGRMKPYSFCRMMRAFEDLLYRGTIIAGKQ